MGTLLNPRREKFAQLIAKGWDADKAYREAGFRCGDNSLRPAASRLRSEPEVEERINQIMQGGAKRAEISRADIIQRLRSLSEKAEGLKQISAAIRAEELIGKDYGMFVDRKEIKTSILDDMDDAKLADLESKIERSLIAAGAKASLAGVKDETPREQDQDLLSGDGTAPEGLI